MNTRIKPFGKYKAEQQILKMLESKPFVFICTNSIYKALKEGVNKNSIKEVQSLYSSEIEQYNKHKIPLGVTNFNAESKYTTIEDVAQQLQCSTRTIRRNLNKLGKSQFSKIIDGKLHIHESYFDAHNSEDLNTQEPRYFVLYNANEDLMHSESVETFERTRPYLRQQGYQLLTNKTVTLDEYAEMVHQRHNQNTTYKTISLQIESVNLYGDVCRDVIKSFTIEGQEITNFELVGAYGKLILDLANKLYSESDQSKIDHQNYINREKTKKDTYVYLMVDKNTGYYKIGRSKNPKFREKTLQSEKPTIEMLHSFKANSRKEKELHKKYADKRIRGEWFDLTQKDIDYIKSL